MATNEEALVSLDTVGRLLGERYNVAAVDGPLGEALAVAREALRAGKAEAAPAIDGLERVIGQRELYRWTSQVANAIAELREAAGVVEEEESEPDVTKPINRMNKDELVLLAVQRGVTVEAGATVADLRKALTAVALTPTPVAIINNPEEGPASIVEAESDSEIPGTVEEPEPETEEWGAAADANDDGDAQEAISQ